MASDCVLNSSLWCQKYEQQKKKIINWNRSKFQKCFKGHYQEKDNPLSGQK